MKKEKLKLIISLLIALVTFYLWEISGRGFFIPWIGACINCIIIDNINKKYVH